MSRRTYRILFWSLVVLTALPTVLIFIRPSIPVIPTSPEAAKSFDRKLSQLENGRQGAREIRITKSELNSKLKESLLAGSAGTGAVALQAATLNLEGDQILGTFTLKVVGVKLYLTLGGRLGVLERRLEFKPTELRMGIMPVPISLIEPTLRDRLNTPEMREAMKLPRDIKDVRIENGELVLEGQ